MKITRKQLRVLIESYLAEGTLSQRERDLIRAQVEVELGEEFELLARQAKSLEDFNRMEKIFLADVEKETQRRIAAAAAAKPDGEYDEMKVKIEDKPKWSDQDWNDAFNQQQEIAPYKSTSITSFDDEDNEDQMATIDITPDADGDNDYMNIPDDRPLTKAEMSRRDFLKNSFLGTLGAAYVATANSPLFKKSNPSMFDQAKREAESVKINVDTSFKIITPDEIKQVAEATTKILDILDDISPKELGVLVSIIFKNLIKEKKKVNVSYDEKAILDESGTDIDAYYSMFYEDSLGTAGGIIAETVFDVAYRSGRVIFAPAGYEEYFGKSIDSFEDNAIAEELFELYDNAMSDANYFDTRFSIDHTATQNLKDVFQDRFDGLNSNSMIESSTSREETLENYKQTFPKFHLHMDRYNPTEVLSNYPQNNISDIK